MVIGDRLRMLREEKSLTQEQIERRTGLLRCYISRVENGHTVPAVDTLEQWTRALEVPMYHFLYTGDQPLEAPPKRTSDKVAWGDSGKDARTLAKFRHLFGRINKKDLSLILSLAQKMANR